MANIINIVTNCAFLLRAMVFLFAASISACAYKIEFMNFPGFPITGLSNYEYGEYLPLSATTRNVLSVLWYLFLLAITATLPMCIAKCFKSKSFYQAYKMFWYIGAFAFTALTSALTGITPRGKTEQAIVAVIYFLTLFLTIFPAWVQYKCNNKTSN